MPLENQVLRGPNIRLEVNPTVFCLRVSPKWPMLGNYLRDVVGRDDLWHLRNPDPRTRHLLPSTSMCFSVVRRISAWWSEAAIPGEPSWGCCQDTLQHLRNSITRTSTYETSLPCTILPPCAARWCDKRRLRRPACGPVRCIQVLSSVFTHDSM